MLTDEEREHLETLQSKHRILFSGCQILQTSKPFHSIRRHYGDVQVIIVHFFSTKLLAEQTYTEYMSLVTRPCFRLHHFRFPIPRTEWIDGMQKGWEEQVAMLVHRFSHRSLVIMEGIYRDEELRIHYERIWSVLDALERLGTP